MNTAQEHNAHSSQAPSNGQQLEEQGRQASPQRYRTEVQRTDLQALGKKEAQESQGSLELLRSTLNYILRGHVIDERSHVELTESERDQHQQALTEEEVGLQECARKIEHNKEAQAKKQKAHDRIESELLELQNQHQPAQPHAHYQPIVFYILCFFMPLIGIAAWLYYTLVIYNAFARDFLSEATQFGEGKMSLNVILSTHILYEHPLIIITVMLSALIVVGTALAQLLVEQLWKKWMIFVVLLMFDMMVAVKIARNLQEVLTMIGMNETTPEVSAWGHLQDLNTWIVVIFAFLIVLILNTLLAYLIKQAGYRKPREVEDQRIKKWESRLKELVVALDNLQQQQEQLYGQRNDYQRRIAQLQSKLSRRARNVQDIEHSIDCYARGWLQAVAVFPRAGNLSEEASQVINDFKQTHLYGQEGFPAQ